MGLSIGEIIVIIVVAFLVLGPDKLPEAGRTLGKTINSLKKSLSASDLNLKDEVDAIKKETGYTEASAKAKDTEAQFKSELQDLKKDLSLSDKNPKPKV